MNYNNWEQEYTKRFVMDFPAIDSDYIDVVRDFIKLRIETERKEAVEGFARWWNVHGGKGEEFITRNSWREYKEHLTQTKGDKSDETM